MSDTKKNWKKRLAIICGALFVLYVIFGFAGVPLLLRYVGLARANEKLAGKVSVESIRANPFSFTLAMNGIAVTTPDGRTVFAAKRAYGDFAFWSIFGKGWRFEELRLESPHLVVSVDKAGKVNLAELLKPAAGATNAEEKPFVLPLIFVDRLDVIEGGANVTVALPGGDFRRQVGGLSFELLNFSTDPQKQNTYSFAANTAQGEAFAVGGTLKLDPLSSEGSVKIEKLQLEDLDLFAADQLNCGVEAGRLSLSFDYRFNLVSEPRRMQIENGALLLEGMELLGKGEREPFQRIGKLEAKGFGLDLIAGSVKFESVALDGAYLRVERDKQGLLNILRYILSESRQKELAAAVQAEHAAERQKAKARQIRLGIVSANQDIGVALTSAWRQLQEAVDFDWKLDVGELNVSHNTLELRDNFPAKPVGFIFTDIVLHARGLRNYGAESFAWEFSVATPNGGSVRAEGSLAPEPTGAAFRYEMHGVDVSAFAPYLAPFTSAQLVSLKISGEGKGDALFPANALPRAKVDFSVRADDLRIDAPGGQTPVLTVESISLDDAHFSSEPLACHADLLLIARPALNVARDKDGNINLIRLFPELQTRLAEKPSSSAKTAEKTDTASAGKSASATAPIATQAETPVAVPAAWENFSLRELRMEDGSLSLKDDSVRPPSIFAVKDAFFVCGPVALKPGSVSRFGFKAALGGGARGVVALEGEVMPLDPLKSAKFAFNTTAVTLAPFGGYAEPIVGRSMERGTADVNLKYQINGGMMKGDNGIKMSQLSFAQRKPDSTGPNLPLDLGLAILVDRNGVMQIDLPVHGNLNDPDFELKQVVIYAITNVFQKLVTAPFAALGSMFGSDAVKPATEVVFEPGQSEIPPAQLPGINQLGVALNERPALLLVLRPVETASPDIEALRAQALAGRIEAFAKEKGVSADRATERLFNELLDEMDKMPPERRAAIELFIAGRFVANRPAAVSVSENAKTAAVENVADSTKVTPAASAAKSPVSSKIKSSGLFRSRRVYTARAVVSSANAPVATTVPTPVPSSPAATVDVLQDMPSPRRLPLADKRAVLMTQTEVAPAQIQSLAQSRTAAVVAALTGAGAPHPLDPGRVRPGTAWQPPSGETPQPPITGVHLELSVAK